jgi:hypothetical protein
MAEVNKTTTTTKAHYGFLFTRDNYIWMAIGGVIIILGMVLMAGGKSPDPKTFDTNLVYSKTRITVAPIVILLGFVVEIYAIFKKPRVKA